MKEKSCFHSYSAYVTRRTVLFGYITIRKEVYLAGEALAALPGSYTRVHICTEDDRRRLGHAQSALGRGPNAARHGLWLSPFVDVFFFFSVIKVWIVKVTPALNPSLYKSYVDTRSFKKSIFCFVLNIISFL